MLEFLSGLAKDNAIAVLKEDHDTVKDLFDQYEKADNALQKKQIAAEAIKELKIHATIEEEIFYPAVRAQIDNNDLMNEANEEHHVAKLLIAELDMLEGSEEEYKAKFTVLCENIRHHIREEESKMFPKVRSLDLDLSALGQKLLTRKQQLKKSKIPASAEEKMVSHYGLKDDSPAHNAKKHAATTAHKKATASS